MSASNQHLRLSPVRACVLLIVVYLTVCAALFAEEKLPARSESSHSFSPPEDVRVRTQRTQRTGDDRVRAFYDSADALNGHTEHEVLDIAAAIEARSQHPLAEAIVRHAKSLGLSPSSAEDFQAISGKGATATLDGQAVWIGSHRAFEQRGEETPELHDRMEQLAGRGHSVVVIAAHEHVCGLIALGDAIRPNAKDALTAMHQAGIERLVMLSGDNSAAAASVALAVGIDDVRAELLPEDKVAAVEELVSRHGIVGMIGDGVNDAPAMARASLGIAMGAAGTDAALETADIALMSDDLSRVAWLIAHSHRTLRIIRQNITASLGVKAVFVVLTILGHANLWTAIAADMGVSLAVVFNALRLLHAGPGTSSDIRPARKPVHG